MRPSAWRMMACSGWAGETGARRRARSGPLVCFSAGSWLACSARNSQLAACLRRFSWESAARCGARPHILHCLQVSQVHTGLEVVCPLSSRTTVAKLWPAFELCMHVLCRCGQISRSSTGRCPGGTCQRSRVTRVKPSPYPRACTPGARHGPSASSC